MTTWDDPIPLNESPGPGPRHIVEVLAAVDVELDIDRVRLLVGVARQANRRCLSAWLRSHEPRHMGPRATGPYARWINRRRGNTGRFRDGSRLPRAALAAIYFLCNTWWRRELGTAFWCDFRALYFGDDYEGLERLEFINAPALFFVLVAQAVDERCYTAERCKLVHDGNYRKLYRRMP